jgi:hypothetical protein
MPLFRLSAWTRAAALPLGLIGVAAGCSLILDVDAVQCASDGDCQKVDAIRTYTCDTARSVCVAPIVADADPPDTGPGDNVVPDNCSTNQQCIDGFGGVPAICTKASPRTCVKLESEDCKVAEKTGSVANDNAIVIAAFEKEIDPEAEGRFGAYEIPFRDINANAGGLPPTVPGGSPRPLVMLRCNWDSGVAGQFDRAGKHVVGLKDVQAFLSRGHSGDSLALWNNVAQPNGIFLMLPNPISALFDKLTDNGLLYRVQPSSATGVDGMKLMVQALEAQVRADQGLSTSDKVRVAIISSNNQGFVAAADALAEALVWNEVTGTPSTKTDTSSFVQVQYDETTDKTIQETLPPAAAAIGALQAHIVLIESEVSLGPLGAVEKAYTGALKPQYLMQLYLKGPNMVAYLKGASATAVRPRIRALIFTEENGAVYSDFFNRFGQEYPGVPFVNNVYQHFYDAAYALIYGYAAGSGTSPRVTGANIAEGMQRLVPKQDGEPQYNVGRGSGGQGIISVFSGLAAPGSHIDLNGAGNRLDWDTKGSIRATSVDWNVWCVDSAGAVVKTPQIWNPKTNLLEGTYSCP